MCYVSILHTDVVAIMWNSCLQNNSVCTPFICVWSCENETVRSKLYFPGCIERENMRCWRVITSRTYHNFPSETLPLSHAKSVRGHRASSKLHIQTYLAIQWAPRSVQLGSDQRWSLRYRDARHLRRPLLFATRRAHLSRLLSAPPLKQRL